MMTKTSMRLKNLKIVRKSCNSSISGWKQRERWWKQLRRQLWVQLEVLVGVHVKCKTSIFLVAVAAESYKVVLVSYEIITQTV